jgi:vacuolar protein-sorting-associated protein 4
LIKQLFADAKQKRPSVIFIDEIDSLCRGRTDNEDETTRRIKTEILKQMEGVGNGDSSVVILASTNRPWELDSAVLRRFEKRIYIPLPDNHAREEILKIHIGHSALKEEEYRLAADRTEG